MTSGGLCKIFFIRGGEREIHASKIVNWVHGITLRVREKLLDVIIARNSNVIFDVIIARNG